jgi:hypothetical protein
MQSNKYQVIYSESKSKFGDIFEFMGHYPQCDFIYQNVFDSDDFVNIPDRPSLPLLLWHAEEAFVEDTSSINRDFVYVTGNYNLPNYFSIHDIISSHIWKNKLDWNINKSKKFLFLNGRDVGHRRYLLAHLHNNNILKNCSWSYRELGVVDYWFDSVLGFNVEDIAYARSTDHILPHAPFDNTNLIRNLSQDIYQDTYCSIIGETTFQHYRTQVPPLMLTEKTYSACANLHMFIIAGAVGSLALLKKQGFETFDDIWDESYDTVTNTAQRLRAVCETISYVNTLDMPSVYEKCKDRMLHNQNLIYTIDVKSRVDKITEWLTR